MVEVPQKPLTNVQEELLKLYATNISEGELLELKELISRFLFEKAANRADQIWKEKGYDQNTIQHWLNED
jgi:hypothetical protein